MPIYRPDNSLNIKFEKLSTSTLESLHKPKLEENDIKKSDIQVVGKKKEKCFQITMASLCITFIIVALFVAKSLFLHLTHTPFCMIMKVDYFDKENSKIHGSFHESVTIDAEDDFEIIEMPKVRSFMRNVIIHDFAYNITAVVNHMRAVCYVMPLNATRTHKPRNVIELLNNLKSGHYVKRSWLLNEYYSVELPQKQDLSAYGPLVQTDCVHFDVYYLHKIDPEEYLSKGDRQIVDHHQSHIEYSSNDVKDTTKDEYDDYYPTYDQNDGKKKSWTKGDNLQDDEDDEEISTMIKNEDIANDITNDQSYSSDDSDSDDFSNDGDYIEDSRDYDEYFNERYDYTIEDSTDFHHDMKKSKVIERVEDVVNDGARIPRHKTGHPRFKQRAYIEEDNENVGGRFRRGVKRSQRVGYTPKLGSYKKANLIDSRKGCFMRGDSFCLGTIIDAVLPCLKLFKCHDVANHGGK